MNKNILITSAGRRVKLVKAFQNELKQIFPFAKVYTTDLNPHLSSACQVADQAFAICKINDSNYIDELVKICEQNAIGMVIPTIDTELQILANSVDDFNEKNIKVVVSDKSLISTCRNKRITNQFFEENQIAIPKAIDKHNPTFPIFIKPFNGSLSVETHLIEEQSQLTAYLLENEKFMFMEYISPKEFQEYTVDMYYDKNNKLKCVVPRLRLEIRSGEVSKGLTVKNEIVDFLYQKLEYIKGAIGCLTLQVFFNNQTKEIIAIEINARFGGGFPLSYDAGANYPKWLIEEYLVGKNIAKFTDWRPNTLMIRYDDHVIVNNYHGQ